MATLTIRNVPPGVVRVLKELAKRNHRSMEQEVREIVQLHVGDRVSAIEQIERAWASQSRAPRKAEVDSWIGVGRP